MGDDEASFGLHNIHECEAGAPPSIPTTIRLLKEYADEWVKPKFSNASVSGLNLLPWLEEKMNKLLNNASNPGTTRIELDKFDWGLFQIVITKECIIQGQLTRFVMEHDIEDNVHVFNFKHACRVVHNAKDIIIQLGRMLYSMSGESINERTWLVGKQKLSAELMEGVPDLFDMDVYREDTEHVHDIETKNTNFQSLFLHMTYVLSGQGFMKSGDKYYNRIRTSLGVHTLAFHEHMSIDAFVGMHVSEIVNFKAWRWSTQPPSNYSALLDYLKQRPICQTPALK